MAVGSEIGLSLAAGSAGAPGAVPVGAADVSDTGEEVDFEGELEEATAALSAELADEVGRELTVEGESVNEIPAPVDRSDPGLDGGEAADSDAAPNGDEDRPADPGAVVEDVLVPASPTWNLLVSAVINSGSLFEHAGTTVKIKVQLSANKIRAMGVRFSP